MKLDVVSRFKPIMMAQFYQKLENVLNSFVFKENIWSCILLKYHGLSIISKREKPFVQRASLIFESRQINTRSDSTFEEGNGVSG